MCEDSREETMFIFNIKKKKINLSRKRYVAQKVWDREKKKINKGRGCGMQGMFGKEKIVWHEGF